MTVRSNSDLPKDVFSVTFQCEDFEMQRVMLEDLIENEAEI